jgi:hypothetical protein
MFGIIVKDSSAQVGIQNLTTFASIARCTHDGIPRFR